MKTRTRILITTGLILFSLRLSAQEKGSTYGRSGEFEISAGLSAADTYNAQGQQQYNLKILPFANHFLFDKIYFRYDFGATVTYTKSDSVIGNSSLTWLLSPGLGVGYSFALTNTLYLNTAIGYALQVQQTSYGDSSASSILTQNSLRGYPELKYLINDKWSVSLLWRIAINFVSPLNRVTNSNEVRNSFYIVASYRR
jgi:hypothetical protein